MDLWDCTGFDASLYGCMLQGSTYTQCSSQGTDPVEEGFPFVIAKVSLFGIEVKPAIPMCDFLRFLGT